jgi:hypothetical protein
MSIKRRVEEVRTSERKRLLAEEESLNAQRRKNEVFFAPVYQAIAEMEKEYGSGYGLAIDVQPTSCSISLLAPNSGRLEISIAKKYENRIRIVTQLSSTQADDSSSDSIIVETPEEAIEAAIQCVGLNSLK